MSSMFWHVPEPILEVSEPNFEHNMPKQSCSPVTFILKNYDFHSELIKSAYIFETVDVFTSNYAIFNRFREVDFVAPISENRLPIPIFPILFHFLDAYTRL